MGNKRTSYKYRFFRFSRLIAASRVSMLLLIFVCVAAISTLSACSDGLTAEERDYIHNIQWWYLDIPETDKDKLLTLVAVTPEGELENGGGVRGLNGTLKVAIVQDDDYIRWFAFSEGTKAQSAIANPFSPEHNNYAALDNGTVITVNQIAIAKSTGAIVKHNNRIAGYEIGLKFVLDK